jgi:hypothetical protein
MVIFVILSEAKKDKKKYGPWFEEFNFSPQIII